MNMLANGRRLLASVMTPINTTPMLLFVGVFLACGLTRIATSFDSRWSVPLILRLVTAGDLRLDGYTELMRETPGYGVVCVSDAGVTENTEPDACAGHWVPSYPIGGPVLAVPIVLPIVAVFRLAGLDVMRYHARIEMEAASVFVAMTAVLVFAIARRQLAERRAVMLAVLFAFATPAFSTASRALWQHTPSVFLLTLTIYLLLRAEERAGLAAWAALPVALSYTVRPSNALFVLLFTAYVAMRHRQMFWRYALGGTAVAAVFAWVNLSVYGSLLPPYYQARAGMEVPGYWAGVLTAGVGLLMSPSRGLFVFTPVFVFSIFAMAKGSWRTPLAPWLAIGTGVYVALMTLFLGPAAFPGNWWGGASYGPRLLTDLSPILCLFLIPYLEQWEAMGASARRVFFALALMGLLIHYRAGWAEAVWIWNVKPANVDKHNERLWDWADAQFLRFRVH